MNDVEFTAIINTMHANESRFRGDFLDWMADNGHVYDAFSEAADKVWAAGWRHYSARTIMEVIRHRSNVREIHGEYKINNNQIPDMARLYTLLNPERAGLFTLRASDIRCAA
ncbi:MAG: hypothetical protein ABIT70_09860 [Sulfuriferula sp.]